MPTSALTALLDDALDARVASAVSLVASRSGRALFSYDVGFADAHRQEPLRPTHRFDLASVTKALCTSLLLGHALEDGVVRLDDRIPAELSADRPRLRDLLRHTTGLPAYDRVFERVDRKGDARRPAERAFAAHRCTGEVGRQAYSDIGYVALGRWLSQLFRTPLPELFATKIARPLGLARTGFADPSTPLRDAVVTEWCPLRQTHLRGIVHDENCQALGGAAGHAGLFGTSRDALRILESLLGFGPPLLAPSTIATLWSREHLVEGGSYVLGWDTPSGPRSLAGRHMRPDATFGHLGFTGTSTWVDRSRELAVVLFTNRVFPTRDNPRIADLRRATHDAIVELCDAT